MSSSPEPQVSVISKKKKKSKDARNSKPHKAVSSLALEARNEGENPHWAYKPPEGAVEVDYDVEQGDFDWDAVNNDENLELWVIRVPDGLKTKYLEGVNVESLPSTSKSTRIGFLDRKHTSYDVWSVGEENDEKPDSLVAGEEMKRLLCLLPRKKKGGKLYQAPKPVSRHIVVANKSTLPTPDPTSDSSESVEQLRSAPRQKYPNELLTHRFMPYGSLSQPDSASDAMDVDALEPPPSTQVPTNTGQESSARDRKRKEDGEEATPKKSKKIKK